MARTGDFDEGWQAGSGLYGNLHVGYALDQHSRQGTRDGVDRRGELHRTFLFPNDTLALLLVLAGVLMLLEVALVELEIRELFFVLKIDFTVVTEDGLFTSVE